MSRAVIFVNGKIGNIEAIRRSLRKGDFLIAADGGTKYALSLGLIPSVIIGDMDSLSKNERAEVEAEGCKLVQYSSDKNETDFELALQFAKDSGYTEILVAGALGGRFDQALGNLSLLSGEAYADLDICADDGVEEVQFVRGEHVLLGEEGELVSLIPWGGKVEGITTQGLRWPLKHETLYPDKTRGISNELTGKEGLVRIHSGLLLVVHRHGRIP